MGRSLHTVERLVMLRDGKGIAAFSMLCTHQTCLITPNTEGDSGYLCPCHGSRFDQMGRVITGPAREDLPWYSLSILADGIIQVDFSSIVEPDWRLQLPDFARQ